MFLCSFVVLTFSSHFIHGDWSTNVFGVYAWGGAENLLNIKCIRNVSNLKRKPRRDRRRDVESEREIEQERGREGARGVCVLLKKQWVERERKKHKTLRRVWQEGRKFRKLDLLACQSGSHPKMLGSPSPHTHPPPPPSLTVWVGLQAKALRNSNKSHTSAHMWPYKPLSQKMNHRNTNHNTADTEKYHVVHVDLAWYHYSVDTVDSDTFFTFYTYIVICNSVYYLGWVTTHCYTPPWWWNIMHHSWVIIDCNSTVDRLIKGSESL